MFVVSTEAVAFVVSTEAAMFVVSTEAAMFVVPTEAAMFVVPTLVDALLTGNVKSFSHQQISVSFGSSFHYVRSLLIYNMHCIAVCCCSVEEERGRSLS